MLDVPLTLFSTAPVAAGEGFSGAGDGSKPSTVEISAQQRNRIGSGGVVHDVEIRTHSGAMDAGAVDAAFAEFYSAEFVAAARLAHLLTGRNDVAEDLAQDAMERVRKHFAELDKPAAYLRTAVVNRCRNWHRGSFRERARHARALHATVQVDPEVDDLLKLVDRLPYRQRAVIVMRYWWISLKSTSLRSWVAVPAR